MVRKVCARLPALDGLRGILAVVVVVRHFEILHHHGTFLRTPAVFAVSGFFLMSGHVLARAYSGNFGEFLARRMARLWPLFAATLVVGALTSAAPHLPQMAEFAWVPTSPLVVNAENGPAWSIFIEAWAAILVPATVVARRWGLPVTLSATLLWWAVLSFGSPEGLEKAAYVPASSPFPFLFLLYLPLFFIGASIRHLPVRGRLLESAPCQWLGKVSFSLYLTHMPVLVVCQRAFGPAGCWLTLLLVLPVAWAAWTTIERPSIALSRSLGRSKPALQRA